MGAIAARCGPALLRRLTAYGRNLGLAFQIVDDILDVCGSARELGKTPGKDARQKKATYPALYGLPESRERSARLIEASVRPLSALGSRAERLHRMADFILSRSH